MTTPICPKCHEPAKLMPGSEIYPDRPHLAELKIWACWTCETRVGAHKHSDKPYGTLAGGDLRFKRQRTHDAFDGLWKSGLMDRDMAYNWLSRKMGLHPDKCHIAMFNEQQCDEVIKYCEGLV